jgi:hypothetical protein
LLRLRRRLFRLVAGWQHSAVVAAEILQLSWQLGFDRLEHVWLPHALAHF